MSARRFGREPIRRPPTVVSVRHFDDRRRPDLERLPRGASRRLAETRTLMVVMVPGAGAWGQDRGGWVSRLLRAWCRSLARWLRRS